MELRKYLSFAALTSVVLLILGFSILLKSGHQTSSITLKNTRFSAEVAGDPMSRAQGLSNRDSLKPNRAMLFSFERSEEQCFWMRDMKFAIDIVWLDDLNRVIAIERNVKPDTYPKNFCHHGLLVIEFAAGTADRLGLANGDQADL